MSRRKKYKAQSYESAGDHFINAKGKLQADTSANIYESMLMSGAFQTLTAKQQILYVCCKAQAYGKRKPMQDNAEYQADCFYFNWQKALDYGLYTESSSRNFYRDMRVLIDSGLIELVQSGKGHKQKNIYKYSAKWQSIDCSE